MHVLILGLPYFSKLLQGQLSEFKPDWDFRCLKPDLGRLRNVRTGWAIANSDVLYMISSTLGPHAGIKLALRLRKRVVMHWVGTDVLEARAAMEAGRVDRRFVDGVVHCCEVPWIQEELKAIGIEATLVPLAAISIDGAAIPDRASISVLGYVGEGRETFYGLPRLLRLAAAFPNVPFRLAGIQAMAESIPSNVTLLGWVDDMPSEYRRATHYLRLPDHDGLAFSVIEALRWGCEVGYTYPFPCTTQVRSDESAKDLLQEGISRMAVGAWKPNLAGHDYVERSFNDKVVLAGILKVLQG
jgi:hypothetical protein